MTLIEKLRKEHPEETNSFDRPIYCPTRYGYAECPLYCEDIEYGNARKRCTDCWNREIPEEKEEKENKPMKKTKAMLEEELEQKRAEIEDLKKELEKAEKYKQYEDAAGELKAAYDSFVDAGFDKNQAFVLITIMLQNQKAAPAYTWESYLSKYLDARKKERRNV